MEKNYCVYIHTNKINNKKYIGLTGQDPNVRWRHGNNYLHSTYFRHAIEKYGWENFEHEIYKDHLTANEASELEKLLIKQFNTTDENYGYNLDSGGHRTTHSESTKEKMRQKATGRKHTPETIEKLRKNATGNKNSLGKRHTKEAKQKNREAHIGRTHTLTEDAKRRIMLSQKTRREILCVELNKVFPSVCSAARFINGSQGTISSVLAKKRKTAYGYHWEYNDNDKSNDYPERE